MRGEGKVPSLSLSLSLYHSIPRSLPLRSLPPSLPQDLRLLHVRLQEEAAEWSSTLAMTTKDLKATAQAALGDAAHAHEEAVEGLEQSHEAELEEQREGEGGE